MTDQFLRVNLFKIDGDRIIFSMSSIPLRVDTGLKLMDSKFLGIEEITDQTIPEDWVNKRKRIHRCWRIFV